MCSAAEDSRSRADTPEPDGQDHHREPTPGRKACRCSSPEADRDGRKQGDGAGPKGKHGERAWQRGRQGRRQAQRRVHEAARYKAVGHAEDVAGTGAATLLKQRSDSGQAGKDEPRLGGDAGQTGGEPPEEEGGEQRGNPGRAGEDAARRSRCGAEQGIGRQPPSMPGRSPDAGRAQAEANGPHISAQWGLPKSPATKAPSNSGASMEASSLGLGES